MKIIQVAESFGAGVYSFLVDMSNDLAEEHEVVIVYSKRKETPKNFINDFHPKVRFIEIDMRLKNSLLAIIKLRNIIKEENPNIVHLHSSKAGFVGRVAAKLANYKGKLFYNPHGLAYLRLDFPKVLRKILFIAEKILTKLGGLVIAVSESEKKEVQKFTNNVIRINNGIDIEKFERELNNINKKKNNDSIIIGTVGRIEYQKNPMLFNEIAESFPNIKFLWIGDGSLRGELRSGNIEITGWLDRKEVLKRLLEIDIYIQTSLWEGLPISVLEAMYLKKPIVAKKTVGNVDLVKPNYNGFIFCDKLQAKNYLNQLLANKEEIYTFGNNSRKKVIAEFSLANTIRSYREIYFQIGNVR